MFNFTSENKTYIALIGDIVKSKQLKERSNTQEKLQAVLDDINTTYQADISSKFLITLGDEFQGLLHRGTNLLAIIGAIEDVLYPAVIRFAIGVGTVTTAINPDWPFGSDGPAYYSAREVLDTLKTKENKKMAVPANMAIKTTATNNIDDLINILLAFMHQLKASWTPRQREIILAYQENKEIQTAVALRLSINQSTVQRALQKAAYYSYKSAVYTLTDYFSRMGGG